MMPAMGINLAFKGATEDDIRIAQDVFDGYQGKPYFDPIRGAGNAFIVDDWTLESKYELGYDLSTDGVITIKGGEDEAVIAYDKMDRSNIIQQLVLMFSGYRFADADYADIYPILAKGCRFSWTTCRDGDFYKETKKLLDVGYMAPKDVDLFIQITLTTNNLVEIVEDMNKICEGYNDVVVQLLAPDDNDMDVCKIALFSTDK